MSEEDEANEALAAAHSIISALQQYNLCTHLHDEGRRNGFYDPHEDITPAYVEWKTRSQAAMYDLEHELVSLSVVAEDILKTYGEISLYAQDTEATKH
jgi:hypothetical protein